MSETLYTELPRLEVSISFVPDVLDDVSDISDGDIPDVPDKDVDEDFEPADLKQGAFKKHLLEGCWCESSIGLGHYCSNQTGLNHFFPFILVVKITL